MEGLSEKEKTGRKVNDDDFIISSRAYRTGSLMIGIFIFLIVFIVSQCSK